MSLHLQITTSNEVYDLDLGHTARNKVRAEVATIARDGLWIGDDEFIPASQIIRIKIQAGPPPRR